MRPLCCFVLPILLFVLGAEGIATRRTSFKASVVDGSADGQMPPWRAALASLVAQMTAPGKEPR